MPGYPPSKQQNLQTLRAISIAPITSRFWFLEVIKILAPIFISRSVRQILERFEASQVGKIIEKTCILTTICVYRIGL